MKKGLPDSSFLVRSFVTDSLIQNSKAKINIFISCIDKRHLFYIRFPLAEIL